MDVDEELKKKHFCQQHDQENDFCLKTNIEYFFHLNSVENKVGESAYEKGVIGYLYQEKQRGHNIISKTVAFDVFKQGGYPVERKLFAVGVEKQLLRQVIVIDEIIDK